MSHFTVLVVGDDVEHQLAPFHEFECTGIDDEFVVDVDITAKVQEQIEKEGIQDALGWFGLEDRKVESESEIDRERVHKYGYALVQNGALVRAIDRTNPNKKWDWYQIGGRWAGSFHIKPEFQELYRGKSPNFSHGWNAAEILEVSRDYRVDSAIKDHVDFELKASIAAKKAADDYDFAFREVFGDLPVNISWEVLRDMDHIDESKARYWAQPRCSAWDAARKRTGSEWRFSWLDNSPDDFLCTREFYVELARKKANTHFAFLRNRQWAQRCKMGWFACVSDENDAWEDVYAKLLSDVPGNERLTVVDCHI